MRISYDIEKLNDILRDYTAITGLSIAVVDRDYRYIAISHSEKDVFCRRIQESRFGHEKCVCSDTALLTRCAESRKAEFHTCHAGLADAAVPIIKDDNVIAYVLLGQIRKSETMDGICDRLGWVGEDNEVLNGYYQKQIFYDEAHTRSAVNLAIAVVTYILVDDMVKMEYNRVIEKAVALISKNLDQPLSVGFLCSCLNVSKNVLYENFRLAMNITISEYISCRRIERAEELLKNTDKPLNLIAEEVGLPNYTYFIKLFKKRTGLSPMQYRRQYQKI